MKFRKIYNLLPQIIGFLTLLCFVQISYAQVPTLKNPNQAVQDYVNLLSEKEQAILNDKLIRYTDSTSTGIIIAIVPSIEDDINFQAAQILSEWKIGKKGKDNGVLILMAFKQKKVTISTGYGVEEFLTDALSKQIITQDMIPYFKQGNYYAGFDHATTSIIKILEGTYKQDAPQENIPLGILIVAGIILLIIISSFKKQNKGNHRGQSSGFDLFDMIILSNLGRNSGGFGGSFGGSSGGFGGFGGGSGGGGGASGSW